MDARFCDIVALEFASELFLLKETWLKPVSKKYTLGKNERLKSRKQIEELFSEGKKISIFPISVYYLSNALTTDDSHFTTQMGVGVSGRNFKRAVDRNRVKRLMREAYRLQKQDLLAMVAANNMRLNVFFIYNGKELPGYKLVYDGMGVALQKLSFAIERQRAK
ncbi:MAG TPA: ribonuclease P protein component [Chitinophagaceae bacterium]|nr:ribonuclease P protein component [Chitinophagaceae bacterium]